MRSATARRREMDAPNRKEDLRPAPASLENAPIGVRGLDEITGGGLPGGHPTPIYDATGCGKTLLALESLVRGATDCNEPGVFVAFESTEEELARNVASLGIDLKHLIPHGQASAPVRTCTPYPWAADGYGVFLL